MLKKWGRKTMIEILTSIIMIVWFIAKICLIIMLIELIPSIIGICVNCDNTIWFILCVIPTILAIIVFLLSHIGFLILTLLISLF